MFISLFIDMLAKVFARSFRIPKGLARMVVYILFGLIVFGTIFLALSVLAWPVVLVTFWHQITESAKVPWVRWIFTVACIVVGILLYLARTYMRQFYGAAEILIGSAACWAALGSPFQNDISGVIPLAGGLYIIVRGIDNVRGPQNVSSVLATAKTGAN